MVCESECDPVMPQYTPNCDSKSPSHHVLYLPMDHAYSHNCDGRSPYHCSGNILSRRLGGALVGRPLSIGSFGSSSAHVCHHVLGTRQPEGDKPAHNPHRICYASIRRLGSSDLTTFYVGGRWGEPFVVPVSLILLLGYALIGGGIYWYYCDPAPENCNDSGDEPTPKTANVSEDPPETKEPV